jgi:aspartate/methionine/tyrosine aminotransferase
LGPTDPSAPLTERNDYGWQPLVRAIATRYHVAPEAVVPAAGTSMANHLAIATLIEPGDHVLVEHPVYDPLERVPPLWGATVGRFPRLPSAGYAIDLDALRTALTPRTRLIVLSDLHNPTGAHIASADLRALATIAESHDLYVLIDEVYGEWMRERGEPSTVHVSPRFLTTSSLTKVWGLGGLRIGWILADPPIAERMRRFAALFDNVLAHPSERLAVRAIERAADIIRPHFPLLDRNRALLRDWIATIPGARWVEPPTGAIAFVDLGIGDVWAFVDRLARASGTRMVPGHFFGAPDHVRIALGTDTPTLERGLGRVTQALAGRP